MAKNFMQFVADLKDPTTFAAWGPALALLDVGNFTGLSAFGQGKGYAFSKDDVKAFLAARPASAPPGRPDAAGPSSEVQPGSGAGPGPSGAANGYLGAWSRQ